MSKIYTSQVIEICENGDAIIELPKELMKDMGWKTNDLLDIDYVNGELIIKKIEETCMKRYWRIFKSFFQKTK
jgi:bifunctional DNA-binding transcriptional regulator/antitoxin component of YhaV-PrlF toxin-antitoxin module